MITRAQRRLARRLSGPTDQARVLYAVVASVSAPTVTLTVRGTSVPGVHYLGAAPVAGTTVACLVVGHDLLVLGTPSR